MNYVDSAKFQHITTVNTNRGNFKNIRFVRNGIYCYVDLEYVLGTYNNCFIRIEPKIMHEGIIDFVGQYLSSIPSDDKIVCTQSLIS